MKPTVDDLHNLIEILKEAETIRPLIKAIIATLKSFSCELKDIPESISDWTVENRIRTIAKYEAAGFTRDDSILMTLDQGQRLEKRLSPIQQAMMHKQD